MSPTVVIAQRSPALSVEWTSLFGGIATASLEAPSAEQAFDAIDGERAGVLVLLIDDDPLAWVRRLRARNSAIPIIVFAATSSEDRVIGAFRAGATDYVRQSRGADELARAVKRSAVSHEAASAPCLSQGRPMVGQSCFVQDLRARIARAAGNDSNVLITGETGTGKDLVAELIHENSARRRAPLIAVNCAAIPEALVESELFGHERGAFTGAESAREGKFKGADGGTIFLDEIGDMNLAAQAKILRVIESREYQRLGSSRSQRFDTRVITATNQNIERFVDEGRFRRDLYFRLNVVRIHLAPLREHPEDVPSLVAHFLRLLSVSFGQTVRALTDDLHDRFLRYPWPGNIRELRNVLEGVFADGAPSVIGYPDLPPAFRAYMERSASADLPERARMLAALQATDWNITRAAEKMSWSRMTFYRKMAKHQIAGGRP